MRKIIIIWMLFIFTLISPFDFSYGSSNDTQLLKTEIELLEAQKDVMVQEYEKIIQSLENLIKTKDNSDFKEQKIAQEFWKSGTFFSSAAIEQLNAIQKYSIEKTEEYKIYLNLVEKEYTYNLTVLNNLIDKKNDLYYKNTGIKLNETEEEKAQREKNEKNKKKMNLKFKNGKELFNDKKYGEAFYILKETCLTLNNYSYDCNYMLGVSQYQNANYDEALEYLKKAQKENNTDEVGIYIEKVNEKIDLRKKNLEDYENSHKKSALNTNKNTKTIKKEIITTKKTTPSDEKIIKSNTDYLLKLIKKEGEKLSSDNKIAVYKQIVIELNKVIDSATTTQNND